MKIYFTASLTGKKYYLENYKKIMQYLEEMDCKVFSGHVFTNTKQQLLKETREERVAYHSYMEGKISWCDAVIAEVSFPSTSVGYEISIAVKKDKPVIALYFEKGGDYPPILRAREEENTLLIDYNFDNLKSLLKGALNLIKTKSLEKRFTMLLPPDITNYLIKVSKKNNTHRSVYIRRLIEMDMRKKSSVKTKN
jgi:nucleoside 2-deoxyribosyltransferase